MVMLKYSGVKGHAVYNFTPKWLRRMNEYIHTDKQNRVSLTSIRIQVMGKWGGILSLMYFYSLFGNKNQLLIMTSECSVLQKNETRTHGYFLRWAGYNALFRATWASISRHQKENWHKNPVTQKHHFYNRNLIYLLALGLSDFLRKMCELKLCKTLKAAEFIEKKAFMFYFV